MPSRHQIGPSPSQTRVGVQVKTWPSEMTVAASRSANSLAATLAQRRVLVMGVPSDRSAGRG
jgi:hypothetical protein